MPTSATPSAEIDRMKNEDVSDADLAMVKTWAKADQIRQLNNNSGLAQQSARFRRPPATGASFPPGRAHRQGHQG
jgi:hypothetical protein